MLVLSRKVGEKLHIGNDIVITITQVKGNRVKIGIEAPEDVRIVRDELKEAVQSFQSTQPILSDSDSKSGMGLQDSYAYA
ncbi:Carbon storage regulator CsrA [Planctomycetales bacterium 10988]|nr:Carbon storage regulator CsrA [Planctomycetales bacterium 10988]